MAPRARVQAFALVTLSSIATTIGFFCWRFGIDAFAWEAIDIALIGSGYLLYGLGVIAFIAALARADLVQVHPLRAQGYVWAFVLGVAIFGEALTLLKVLGTSLVLVGSIVLGVSR